MQNSIENSPTTVNIQTNRLRVSQINEMEKNGSAGVTSGQPVLMQDTDRQSIFSRNTQKAQQYSKQREQAQILNKQLNSSHQNMLSQTKYWDGTTSSHNYNNLPAKNFENKGPKKRNNSLDQQTSKRQYYTQGTKKGYQNNKGQ